jgi:hypothetical protein
LYTVKTWHDSSTYLWQVEVHIHLAIDAWVVAGAARLAAIIGAAISRVRPTHCSSNSCGNTTVELSAAEQQLNSALLQPNATQCRTTTAARE